MGARQRNWRTHLEQRVELWVPEGLKFHSGAHAAVRG